MTRAEWTMIAQTLAELRKQLEEHAVRSTRQRAAHIARIEGVELAARSICRALHRRHARFDGRHFMRVFAAAK